MDQKVSGSNPLGRATFKGFVAHTDRNRSSNERRREDIADWRHRIYRRHPHTLAAGEVRERRAFVRSISDRYNELAQKPEDEPFTKSWNTKDEFWRIGTLQDLGAGALRPFEFRRVCDRIASCGLEDPRQREIYVFEDDRRDLLTLLRWGESISLHNVERLMRIRAEEVDAANPQDKSA